MQGKNDEFIFGSGVKEWGNGKAYSITFVVTEECNLRCKYCYQVHKNNKKRMTFDVAKKAIDYILSNPKVFNAECVIWDFIGGEPLLELDLIDKICDYIKIQTFKLNHPWAYKYRFSIGTNGVLYGSEQMRRFVYKNKLKSNVGITIDGIKEKHDMHRVFKDQRGSYDEVVKNIRLWQDEYPGSTTKVTFSNEDLVYLKDSIVHLWNLGLKNVPANIVFEDVWKESDAKIFEEQLKLLADYVLENELWNEVNTTLFDEYLGQPNDDHTLHSNFCGSGRMLAIDANGDFYPCIRFLDFSLSNHKAIKIGDEHSGINTDKVRPFLGLSLLAQSDKECVECEVAQGCAWCQGNNYDSSKSGTIYYRPKYICEMHKARCRANEYYWNKLFKKTGIQRSVLRTHKKHLYFIMSDDSVEHCNYKTSLDSNNIMPLEIIKKGLEFSERNFYKPIILNSKKQNNIVNIDEFSKVGRIDIYKKGVEMPYKYYNGIEVITKEDLLYENNNTVKDSCILNLDYIDIKNLHEYVINSLDRYNRVNVNIIGFKSEFDEEKYKQELNKICDYLCELYINKKYKEVNLITDRLFIEKMDNCESGDNNFALAPNGNIYICPAFYFYDEKSAIGNIYDESIVIDKKPFMLESAQICKECDAFQCSRCVFKNKNDTGEFNIPGSSQCRKSHIEREASLNFYNKLKKEGIDVENLNNLERLSYYDPMENFMENLDLNPYGKLC